MPAVLTTTSTVGCGHDPGRVATASAAKLRVAGAAVLRVDSIAGKAVSGCPTPSSNSTKPCTAAVGVTGGIATKLTAAGAPVVLATITGTTDGVATPPGLLKASGVQTKLTAR
jgi:hypothetical protein